MQDVASHENIWISASAGSGKTKALIDRFLKILLDGVPPTKILCITFTKAAAAEMLGRITDELTSFAICDESELVDKLTKLTGSRPDQVIINRARNGFEKFIEARSEVHISTIHSFCQKLIETFPLECNKELGYKLADEQLIKTIVEEAKLSFLNDDSMFTDESIQYLFRDINEFKLDILLDKVLSVHNLAPYVFIRNEKLVLYIEALRKDLNLPDNYSQEKELKNLITQITSSSSRMRESSYINSSKRSNSMFEANTSGLMDPRIREDDELRKNLSDQDAFEYFKNIFLTKKNTPRINVLKKEETSKEAKLIVNEIQDLLLSYMQNESAYKVYKQTFGFFSLGNLFMQHYAKVKTAHGILDYGDIIQRGVSLLESGGTSSWLLYNLNNKFSNVLVDEAQDLEVTQWRIIEAISNEFFYNPDEGKKSIFIVGDPKQSIYSFQGASPLLLKEAKEKMEAIAGHYNIGITHRTLNESFRSDPIILRFVDQVFEVIRKRNPEYFLDETNHTSNKKFEKASIEAWPLITKQESDNSSLSEQWKITTEYKEADNPSKTLVKKIGTRIEELLREGYLPSDIMILVRKRDKLIEEIVMELKSNSISVSGVDRLVLNDSLAIKDLIAMGRFILSQYDDYNLACLLKSPIFSLSEEELFEVCNREEISLWENIKRQGKPIAIFLTSILEDKSNYSPYKFFSYILDVLSLRTKFLSRFGPQLNEILDEFLNTCLTFETDQSTSLSLFIDWFAKTEIEIKRDSYADANEVRLMTIHASKGLQAKIVIMPDTTSIPKHNKGGVLYNTATRRLIVHYGANDNIFCKKMLDEYELQTMQEYYRLLYVALTRAAEKLIICGWSNTKKINPNSWYSLLTEVEQCRQEDESQLPG
jgi:ATP-dependent helicase/nuclease subunit A